MYRRIISGRALLLAAALIAFFFFSTARAEETPPAGHSKPIDVAYQRGIPEQITVVGRAGRSAKAPLAGDALRSNAPVDTGEALDTAPGITMVRRGAIANDVVFRSFSRDRLNVVADGQQLHGAGPNRMDPPLLQVDPDEIEKVELVKGPFDLRHPGSLGGLVHIRTRDPEAGFHAKIGLGTASFDHREARGRLAYGGKRFSGLLGVSTRRGDPYASGNGTRITEIYSPTSPHRYLPSARRDKAFDTRNLWSKLIAHPRENQKLAVSFGHQKATDVIYPYLVMDATRDESLRAAASYTVNFDEGPLSHLEFELNYDRVEHDMNNALRANPMAMQTEADSSTTGAALRGSFDALGGELTLGADALRRDWDVTNEMRMPPMMGTMGMAWKQNMLPDTTHRNFGAFVEYRGDVAADLEIRGGLRLDRARSEAREDPRGAGMKTIAYTDTWPGAQSTQRETEWSGNLQLTWRLDDRASLFIGAGRGVRMPDAVERFVARAAMSGQNWVGNPGLAPEKNDEIDLGFDFSSDRFECHASVFASRVHDYIALVQKPSFSSGAMANTYANTDARLYGAELELDVELTDMVSLYGDAETVRGKKERRGNLIVDRDLAETPPLHAHLGTHFDFGPVYAEIEGELATAQGKVDSDLNEMRTDGWAIANLRAGGTYKGLRIDATLRNLFNRSYERHLSYLRNPFASGVRLPEPGRRFSLTLSLAF